MIRKKEREKKREKDEKQKGKGDLCDERLPSASFRWVRKVGRCFARKTGRTVRECEISLYIGIDIHTHADREDARDWG